MPFNKLKLKMHYSVNNLYYLYINIDNILDIIIVKLYFKPKQYKMYYFSFTLYNIVSELQKKKIKTYRKQQIQLIHFKKKILNWYN